MTIQTVTGPIAPQDLGHCQCHEHLLLAMGTSYTVNPALWFDDVDCSAAEAERYVAAGGGAVVDAQPVGCGRMAWGLAEISRRTGLQILSSTGFHKLCFYPREHWIRTLASDALTHLFLQELQVGMYDDGDDALPRKQTDIRAAVIKTALDRSPLDPRYGVLFQAAAQAALASGRPLMVHIESGSDPLALLEQLLAMGLPPRQLIFCHTDRACDDDTRLALAARGIFLDLDTIGRFRYHDDAREIELLRQLLDAGHENQLLLALDTTRARLRSYTPDGVGLDYLFTTFLPAMEAAGIPAKTIARLTRENPASAMAGCPVSN